jgi:hypothetical protein
MAEARNLNRTGRARGFALAVALALAGTGVAAGASPAAPAPVTVTEYADAGQALNWGTRSHWKQPWRSYLETVPATVLRDALGVNFNVPAGLARPTARLLAASGFRRARIEVGWGTIDYADPSRMSEYDREQLATRIDALRENGIRPLILLNANHGRPCPVKRETIELLAPAEAGARTILVAPADTERISPGRTGITRGGVAAQTLFASALPNGTVQLSRPLPDDLPAGSLKVVTLRYEPFRPATLADGSPNPGNARTLAGWLDYSGVVAREVESLLGSEEFDVEVWNELSFGSRFLNINAYYEPDVELGSEGNSKLILESTVDFLRDPANGVPDVEIGNGFANQAPWTSGSKSPVGLSAIDKHPYAGWRSFPADAVVDGNRPLDGLGELAGWKDADSQYHESFVPAYEAFFPEYFLSAIQTETLTRDLSPQPSTILDVEHGRHTHPPGGEPPAMWITEVNLAPGSGPVPREAMSDADVDRVAAKIVLRYLVAYVNKGAEAIHFYAVDAGGLSLVEPAFLAAASSGAYPGEALGGQTMDALRRLIAAFDGAEPIASPRGLSLRELTDFAGNVQFEGDGSAAYPPLYDRDVFAFLPFQVDEDRFVVPVYVMTRNVVEEHPGASGPGRFDLPAETYRLRIGGVAGTTAEISASDPLTGEAVAVEVVSRSPDEIAVELAVTDSPRLLTIQEPHPIAPPDPAPPAAPPPIAPAPAPAAAPSPPVAAGVRRPGSGANRHRRCRRRQASARAWPSARSRARAGRRSGRCGHRRR